jgi:phosphatidylethanolamine N-methyltransferase
MLILVICYSLVVSLLPRLSQQATVLLHFGHALSWCIFHCFGLGLLLRAQSQNKYLVRHYMKHYHYSQTDGGTGAVQEAFTNWKSIYNLSLCMTYGTTRRFYFSMHSK